MKNKIVIAGGSGFIGSSLANYFASQGNEVVVLTRKNNKPQDGIRFVHWDGATVGPWQQELEGAIALINMAGRSVDCRYNKQNKEAIYASRLNSTHVLGQAIMQCSDKPSVWLNSSSATIYRHAEDRPMTEYDGEIGTGFSVDVCQKWEHSFFQYKEIGVRQVALRTAIVLGEHGVMKPFKTLTRFGFGGYAGTGNQMFSWIHITDLCKAIHFIISNSDCRGIYNLSAPFPITNRMFMKALRLQMGVPFGVNMPTWMLDVGAILIQTETELLLKSRWVLPQRLMESNFTWEYPHIEQALNDLIPNTCR